MRNHRAFKTSIALLAVVVAGAALSPRAAATTTARAAPTPAAPPTASTEPVTLRLGYFPNVTHAPALVGIEGGIFEKNLGKNVTLETTSFNAGGDVITAIFAGELDASFIGPGPSISAFQQSNGEAIRIVSGAASGGAYLVVEARHQDGRDLKGKTIATPQLGNTQDVALRTWLKDKGFETDTSGGGDVNDPPAGELADPRHVPGR